MKIVFASHGSLGDLVPFLEIGKVLRERGHQVVVATHRAHEGAVRAAGFGFAPMRPDRPDTPEFHRAYMATRSGPAFIFKSFLGPAIADSDRDLTEACRDADLLVSVTLALAAPIVAARTGIPWVSTVFQPAMFYSAYDPPRLPMLPFLKGWIGFNEWVLRSARKGIKSWAEPLRAYRRAEGLGEYPDHPAFGGQHSPTKVLALYSPLFGSVPPDAPAWTVQTGQVLQSGSAQELPDEVEAFLDEGPPPIVFTLGSASANVAQRFFLDSTSIARRLGERALLLVGKPQNLEGLRDAPGVLAGTVAPYHKVFGRARLVVHQGGIGTIALAAAAGRPMVLVPFCHDQPDNAYRAQKAGLGRVVPLWRYGLTGLGAVRAALRDTAMADACAAARTQLAGEHGAERAAAEILQVAQASAPR